MGIFQKGYQKFHDKFMEVTEPIYTAVDSAVSAVAETIPPIDYALDEYDDEEEFVYLDELYEDFDLEDLYEDFDLMELDF